MQLPVDLTTHLAPQCLGRGLLRNPATQTKPSCRHTSEATKTQKPELCVKIPKA